MEWNYFLNTLQYKNCRVKYTLETICNIECFNLSVASPHSIWRTQQGDGLSYP